jgi:SprT protein
LEIPVSWDHSELVEIAKKTVESAFSRYPLSKPPIIEWRALRVTAGVAYFRDNRIVLSSRVLKNPEQVAETALHEYAHLLAFHRHGRAGMGHGHAWKQAMTDLGLKPKVHHKFEVERNQSKQQVIYKCRKCGTEFVRKRKLNANRKYFHLNCGGSLLLVETRKATHTMNDA